MLYNELGNMLKINKKSKNVHEDIFKYIKKHAKNLLRYKNPITQQEKHQHIRNNGQRA